MSPSFADWDEGTLDLAVARCTVGLDDGSEQALLRQTQPQDLLEFEWAVAAIHLSHLEGLENPPAKLRQRLLSLGESLVRKFADSARLMTPARRPRSLPRGMPAFLLAAAALLLLLFWLPASQDANPFDQRQSLLARADDVVRYSWTQTEDPAAVKARGDVIWSAAQQEGYMRFEGLEINEPSSQQYQLWIFDKSRADWEAKPVDGGVFDVQSAEVVIPIDPKLKVREGVLFAVTLEVPGGVVVSDRDRLVLLAQP